ncbi:hypothetical protein ACQPZP_22985 [Spirillospora sp. CA-142024]|uniref:hypothetical protein n=1 Tax=Spirillospora sp. CA-142024 TaxID=3240036 RepID=UPI003D8E9C56
MAGGISLSGAPAGRWTLVHDGRRLEVETERAGWDHIARLYVDGDRVEEGKDFPKVTLPYGELSVVVGFDVRGLADGQAARCELRPPKPAEDDERDAEPDGEPDRERAGFEPVAFEPPEGTRAARREAFARAHPALYASRHVAVATGQVLFPLLGLGALVKVLLDRVPWPEWRLPDIDPPSIPWPDIPWPDVPWPDLPDFSAPPWVRALLAAAKFAVPIVIAIGVAVKEVERRKRAAAQRGDRSGAGDDVDGGGQWPAQDRAGGAGDDREQGRGEPSGRRGRVLAAQPGAEPPPGSGPDGPGAA